MNLNDEQQNFPEKDIKASLNNSSLQKENPLTGLKPDYRKELDRLRQAAIAKGASENADWVYFRSPEWTWRDLCGREGWLLYDPSTNKQYAFVATVIN